MERLVSKRGDVIFRCSSVARPLHLGRSDMVKVPFDIAAYGRTPGECKTRLLGEGVVSCLTA